MGIAFLMLILSVAVAVRGYEVDENIYRLAITGVAIDSSDQLSFTVTNNRNSDLDLSTVHSYEITVNNVLTRGVFSHSIDEPLPLVGMLRSEKSMDIGLPQPGLVCHRPITVEIYTFKGALIARWVGIPQCKVTKPRPLGLIPITNCEAEYYDGSLRIRWQLIDADRAAGKVRLQKTIGRKAPVDVWVSEGSCPDLESGSCMTDIESIKFTHDSVFVELTDNRHDTSVTLSDTPDSPTRCLKEQPVVLEPQQEQEQAQEQAQRKYAEPVEAPAPAVSAPASAAPEQFVLTSDRRDTRICLAGCKAGDECFDEGMRHNYLGQDVFCKGQSWMVQKRLDKSCDFNFECASDTCADHVCAEPGTNIKKPGWVTRFLTWIDNLI
ncbi:hypothetical protein KY362_05690 [Candidatus Woesearchaeota archaeon]|nr:hypothetical protein [Candidatus Woesearchaeota archaeon]